MGIIQSIEDLNRTKGRGRRNSSPFPTSLFELNISSSLILRVPLVLKSLDSDRIIPLAFLELHLAAQDSFWGTGSCNYEGWEAPRAATCKLEPQEGQWCNLVYREYIYILCVCVCVCVCVLLLLWKTVSQQETTYWVWIERLTKGNNEALFLALTSWKLFSS